MNHSRLMATVATIALTACGHSADRQRQVDSLGLDGDAASASLADVATSSTPKSDVGACPANGRWAVCSVEKRLEQAGFVLKKSAEQPRRAGFSVVPAVYTLGHARLELFLYPDRRALERDVSKLDTAKVAPVGGSNSWDGTPTFVRSENLAAVFLTDNGQQAERLMLALTAGAPQPAAVPKLKPSISTPSSPR